MAASPAGALAAQVAPKSLKAGLDRKLSDSALLRQHLQATQSAGVLLDWKTGRVLAVAGQSRPARPGSILKPLLLSYALQHGLVRGDTRVYCRRNLIVAGRPLPCTHPQDQPLLDAEQALAASCNTWFAALARHMSAQDLRAVLQQAGLPQATANLDDADTRILVALGLEGTAATPLRVAHAYRALLANEPHTTAVWVGLHDAVASGMANNARVKGVEVLGKTGTAQNAGEWWSHGWFAGGVEGRYVLVVYVPHGDGGMAAAMGGAILTGLLRDGAR